MSITATTMPGSQSTVGERLQCMTVWGGNSATSQVFDVPGLRIWVDSRVHGDDARGGDVYFVSSCASGRLTRLLLADVSGHGAAVSRTADSLRKSMSENVNHINQEKVVRSVNDEFAQKDSAKGFATAVVSTFFSPTGKLTLSNAGHPPPLLYRRATNQWDVFEPETEGGAPLNNLPLGVVADMRFDQSELRLQTGDRVLVYTDAFFESRDVDGEILGSEGLRKLIEPLDAGEPDRLIPELIRSITSLHPDNLIVDDATLILIEATGSGTPFWSSLTAPFRFLGSLLGMRPVSRVDA